jgi:hypothetical protein
MVVRGQWPVGPGRGGSDKGTESNGLCLGSSSQSMLDETDLRDCVNSL